MIRASDWYPGSLWGPLVVVASIAAQVIAYACAVRLLVHAHEGSVPQYTSWIRTYLRPFTDASRFEPGNDVSMDTRPRQELHAPDFRRLFDVAPWPAVVVDRSLRIVAANAALLAAIGRAGSDVLGHELLDVYPRDPSRPGSGALRGLDRAFARAVDDGRAESIAFHEPIRTPGSAGVPHHWRIELVPLRERGGADVEHVLVRTIDMSDAYQLEAARERLESVSAERERLVEELQLLLDLAPDPAVTVNAAGLIIRVNARALDLLGYERDELVGDRSSCCCRKRCAMRTEATATCSCTRRTRARWARACSWSRDTTTAARSRWRSA